MHIFIIHWGHEILEEKIQPVSQDFDYFPTFPKFQAMVVSFSYIIISFSYTSNKAHHPI